jgi:hypothetical protein
MWIPLAAMYNVTTSKDMAALRIGALQLLYRLMPYSMMAMVLALPLDPPGITEYVQGGAG